jgi:hypothetical protein
MNTMKKWVLSVLLVLIILIIATILYSVFYREPLIPNFQVADVSISKPMITSGSNLIFHGHILDSLSFSYAASEAVNCRLDFSNNGASLEPKSVTLEYYTVNDTAKVDTFNVAPFASNSRSFDLLSGQSLSGYFEISSAAVNDLWVAFTYTNYTQSVDFSFNLVNSGSADGFAVVELRSDGASVWSNRYTLVAGGNRVETGTVTIHDKGEHSFVLTVIEQGE